MSITLLLPSALLALLALAVPLLLHLVRKTEQTRMPFAALRWLVARAQPRRRPRFNEWLLLALRLLLLALLALWLAQPVLHGQPDLRPWVVVHPGLETTALPAHASRDARWHWLAPGFPAIDQPVPAGHVPIASLLRELDARLPATVALTAYVPEQIDATDPQRPRLGRAITWRPVPDTSALDRAAAPLPMRVAVHADADHRHVLPYLRAAASAWSSDGTPRERPDTLREIAASDALQTDDSHLLWLASGPVPPRLQEWVHTGGLVVVAQDTDATGIDWDGADIAWRSTDGRPLALRQADGKGRWIRMLVPLTPESLPELLEPGFPRALQDLLQAAPVVATRAWADTYAPVVDATGAPFPPSPRPLGDLLALVIALLFAVERWLAMSMRRNRPA